MTSAADAETTNRFTAHVLGGADGWSVTIVEPGGRVVSRRSCADEREARTFASTVRQHAAWLSEDRFRQIYRLDGGG